MIICKNRHLHDLEGTIRCVEKLDLANASLRDSVVGSAAPAPLHQANRLSCRVTENWSVWFLHCLIIKTFANRLWSAVFKKYRFFKCLFERCQVLRTFSWWRFSELTLQTHIYKHGSLWNQRFLICSIAQRIFLNTFVWKV